MRSQIAKHVFSKGTCPALAHSSGVKFPGPTKYALAVPIPLGRFVLALGLSGQGPAMDRNFSRFDVLVAIVIVALIAAWITAFAGFWIWAVLT